MWIYVGVLDVFGASLPGPDRQYTTTSCWFYFGITHFYNPIFPFISFFIINVFIVFCREKCTNCSGGITGSQKEQRRHVPISPPPARSMIPYVYYIYINCSANFGGLHNPGLRLMLFIFLSVWLRTSGPSGFPRWINN